jgi:hypothetical protein
MDFSKLDQNEKLATYGAMAGIVGGILGGQWLILILGVLMLAVVFLPQWSPQTTLPGSKGSLMLVVGGLAALGSLFGLLVLLTIFSALAFVAGFLGLYWIGLLVSVIGGFVMGWAGWKEFQAEGGKFQIGNASTGSSAPSGPPPAAPSTRDEDGN